MNIKILEQFKLLIKQKEIEHLNALAENNPDEVKSTKFSLDATKKVFNIIRNLNFEISDVSDIDNIPGIGAVSKKRIGEILEKGVLDEIKKKYNDKKNSRINSIRELEQVIGIGSAIAKKLVIENKITSIAELKKAIKNGKITVNNSIILGLKYYGIVQGNIPRSEIKNIESF